MIPAVGDRGVDEVQQRVLGGRSTPPRDPATQSQRPFPSASINLTPISFSASESRAISALAAASSGSGPDPGRTPGLDAANASSAPCRATDAQLHDRRAIHPGPLGRGRDRVLAAHQTQPDLVLLARRQEPLAAPTPRAGTVAVGLTGSLIARSWTSPTGSQMRTDQTGEVWREVRRKPKGAAAEPGAVASEDLHSSGGVA